MKKRLKKMLNINDKTTVVDLYSGIGITSIMFAKNCKEVISIEEVPTAVENAKFIVGIHKDYKCVVDNCTPCVYSSKVIFRHQDEGRKFCDPYPRSV